MFFRSSHGFVVVVNDDYDDDVVIDVVDVRLLHVFSVFANKTKTNMRKKQAKEVENEEVVQKEEEEEREKKIMS